MALTDADRLQIVSMALMRHSVITVGGGGEIKPLIWTIKGLIYIPSIEYVEVSV